MVVHLEAKPDESEEPSIDPALRLIIIYKLLRGLGSFGLSVALGVAAELGYATRLHAMAVELRDNVAHVWALELADLVLEATSGSHLFLVSLALMFDGAVTCLEGWALRQKWSWAPWLVVVATGTFIPFEIMALVHQIRLGRAIIFVGNALIVAYMVRKALRETKASDGSRPRNS